MGYLYRNNLKKVQGGVGLYWPELDLPFPLLEGRVNLNFNKMSNLDNLTLNNSMGLSSTATFDNLWYMGGEFNYLDGHNDDLLSTKSDIMGEGILGLGDFLQSTKKSISNKKKKGKKKGTLIGETGIFKL
mgnify:CR=1 FL=1